jgi:hypothetical protein
MDQPLQSLRQRTLYRLQALRSERSSWISRYREISEFLLPFSGRFVSTDRNKGNKSFNSIIDSTGSFAKRTLAAGMMAGMTSPARPWFKLALPDEDLMEFGPVRKWLDDVTKIMLRIYAKSNTYRALHSQYEELGLYGTGANIIVDDFDNVIHNYALTTGEYFIGTDPKGKVNTLYREYEMPVSQVVQMFVGENNKSGSKNWSNVSTGVKNLWDAGRMDAWIPIVHAIEPRAVSERDLRKGDGKNMPFRSVYLERDAQAQGGPDLVLRESGFKRFRATVPRWAVYGGDIYGNSPGMEALGDVKQLQHEQLRKSQAVDYMTMPPVQAPAVLAKVGVNQLPGGVTYSDGAGGANSIKSLFDVRLDISALREDIADVRQRINRAFYADLFLMLANDTREQPPTAREVAERHEEKLLMLGPVVERLHDELLDQLIDITFERVMETGIAPPPPKELEDMDLQVEFISTLAQAQRAVGLASVDRLMGTVLQIAQVKPDVLDKIDGDEMIDRYADMAGVPPTMIVDDEKVAEIRAARAKQQAAMQQAETAPAMAQTAKTLSETDTAGQNMLTDLTNQFQGYSIPTQGGVQ